MDKAYIDKGTEILKYQKRSPKPKSEIDESKLTEIEKLKLELERERELRKLSKLELVVLKKRGNRKKTSLSKIRY